MPTAFFLARLRPGLDPAAYERWVKEVDYPTSARLKSIVRYRNHRIRGPFRGEGEPAYQYIEVIDFTNLDDYRRDLETPAALEMRRQLAEFILPSTSMWGDAIEPGVR